MPTKTTFQHAVKTYGPLLRKPPVVGVMVLQPQLMKVAQALDVLFLGVAVRGSNSLSTGTAILPVAYRVGEECETELQLLVLEAISVVLAKEVSRSSLTMRHLDPAYLSQTTALTARDASDVVSPKLQLHIFNIKRFISNLLPQMRKLTTDSEIALCNLVYNIYS